jgi:peptidoglycan hydrolase-like protein with peptidoglycan-binding domain
MNKHSSCGFFVHKQADSRLNSVDNIYTRSSIFLSLSFALVILTPSLLFAASSSNYQVPAGNTVQSAGRASSGQYQTVGTFVVDQGVGKSTTYTSASNLNQGQPASPVVTTPASTPAATVSSGGGGGGGGGSFFSYVRPGGSGTTSTTTINTPTIAGLGGAAELLLPPSSLLPINATLNTVHPSIKVLQKFLNNNGFFLAGSGPGSKGKETNKFSKLTKNAVSGFQRLYGPTYGFVNELGYLGTKTRTFINSLLTKKITLLPPTVKKTPVTQSYTPPTPTTPTVTTSCFDTPYEYGQSSPAIIKIQQFLKKFGFMSKDIEERPYFGDGTKQAVKTFQEAYPTEILGPEQLKESTGKWYLNTRNMANKLIGCK